jgi:formylglycine-generating enzyme required for sulfatase activity
LHSQVPYTNLGNFAWFTDNSDWGQHSVGLKPPNAWGLFDMHGNLAEWCLDWYGTYQAGDFIDPKGPISGKNRVFRGGGFISDGRACRSAFREYNTVSPNIYYIGFRPVLAPGQ